MQRTGHLVDTLWATSSLEKQPSQVVGQTLSRMTTEPWLLTTQAITSTSQERWSDGVHEEHELIFSESGVLTVEADGRLWVTPLGLGIWIPAGMTHHVTAEPGTVSHVTYFSPDRVTVPWTGPTGIAVTALLRELLLTNKSATLDDPVRMRVQQLTVDLLAPVRSASLDVHLPSHPALRTVADEILRNPADNGTSEDWGRKLGVSGRTVNRGFERETGSSLTQWRITVRMRRALIDIAAGRSVVSVARDVGYTNSSTFIQLFRQTTGHTPAAYFRSFEAAEPADGTGHPLQEH